MVYPHIFFNIILFYGDIEVILGKEQAYLVARIEVFSLTDSVLYLKTVLKFSKYMQMDTPTR